MSLDHRLSVPAWLPAALLVIGTAVVGPSLGGVSRYAFIAGCAGVGWYAWRRGPAAHVQTILILFCFAPFVRRLVDLSAGYDDSAVMLVGPLAAMLVPTPRLIRLVESDRPFMDLMAPLLIVGACVGYATFLTLLQGEWMRGLTQALKWIAPLLYAALLLETAKAEDVVRTAAATFAVILPIMGAYGIYQHVSPPEWDRYWISYAPVTAGEPVAYGVRTFSTLNGPASFATFTAAGLILLVMVRPKALDLVLAIPAVIALLLSSYRTAWIALAVGVVFFLFHARSRSRATIIVAILAVAGAMIPLTPFAEAVGERLASFGEGSKDGSASERLEQFVLLWSRPDSGLFGVGFNYETFLSAGTMPVDGMIISCWLSMGIVFGLLCLFGLVFAAWRAIVVAWRSDQPELVALGAIACGAIAQIPLANIASGEQGFLFWTFTALTFPLLGPAGTTAPGAEASGMRAAPAAQPAAPRPARAAVPAAERTPAAPGARRRGA